jgi:hypothetical protein
MLIYQNKALASHEIALLIWVKMSWKGGPEPPAVVMIL